MAVKKQKLGPGELTVGETGSGMEMHKQASAVTISPSYSDGDKIYVLSGDADEEEAEWEGTLNVTFYQDYDADGLLAWTWANDGEVLPFTFTPRTGGFTVTGEVKVRPADIGGDVNTDNTSEVEWSLPKKPEIGSGGSGGAGTQTAAAPATVDPPESVESVEPVDPPETPEGTFGAGGATFAQPGQ